MPPLAGRAVIDLREEDLRTLIANASEGRALDFKRDAIGTSDDAKREFLADVSSLANTAGGHIVIGMDEDDGVASDLPGLEIPSLDDEKLRLEAIIRDGLDPRLPALTVHPVPLANGRHALVIDVGHSWDAPHMVTFRGSSRFFARNSGGKYLMDVREIRAAILGGETRAERLRQFHRERVEAVVTGYAIEGGAMASRKGVLLHLLPLGAFDVGSSVELDEAVRRDRDVRPLWSEPGYPMGRFNLDGIFVADTGFGRAEEGAKQYLQVRRNGIIETFDSYLLNYRGEDSILGYPVERTLIDDARRLLSLGERIGVSLPIVVLVTITGAANRVIVTNDRAFVGRDPPLVDRDRLPLPEIIIDDFAVDTSQALRPMLDALWQAGGHPASPNYVDGEWQRRD